MNAQQQIEKFQELIETNYLNTLHGLISKNRSSLIIDFSDLAQLDPELSEDLLSQPEDTIKSAELSLQQFDITQKLNLKVRFSNLPKSQRIMIRNIRSSHIDNLIAIEGLVKQASDVRPQVISAKFECPSCGNAITLLQLEPTFREPTRCSCGRRGKFRLLSKELVDAQRLVLEEAPESLEGGEQPKRISVFLREDLVEPKMEKKTTPGSKIRINGIVKEVPIPSKTGGQSTRFDLSIETNHIEPIIATFEEIEITKEEEEKIKELAKDPKVYEKFIQSIAPSIYGHEDIKGALVLQLMGGVRKDKKDGTFVKGDIHILLVGDPGAAKSSLLMYLSKAAPKARFVSGKGTTGTGVTATVVKDEFLRGWALEAGAIVLANGGLLLLDEMDKMDKEDTSALHEAMSLQTVTISKANIQATLLARTAVLAAANPKFGRFDPYEPIASQIDLPPALINRFDLIFPVRDLPNVERDTRIASHVLEIQQNTEINEPAINTELLKKYIAYVRQNIFPVLTKGAIEEIKSFYVTLRNSGTTEEGGIRPIPISARQLESLVRLAEGSARIRLSNKVTKMDAKNAIEILKHCLMQVGFDYETGQMDIDRVSTGITAAQRNKIVVVRDLINEFESKGKKTMAIEEVISAAMEKGINESQVEEVLEKLKRSGDIFEPKRGFIQKI